MRWLLAFVAIQVIVLSAPALVLGEQAHTEVHAARHLGSFTAAYGIGLLVISIRPARARTILPVAGFVAAALSITAIIDLVNGQIPLLGEASHIPEIIGAVLVWMLANPSSARTGEVGRERPPVLRVLEDRTSTPD